MCLCTCRIGRTGRAGRLGEAVTFFEEDDAANLRAIANVMRGAGCEVPEWMLLLKKGQAPGHNNSAAGDRGNGNRPSKHRTATAKVPISVRGAFESRDASRKEQIIRQSKVSPAFRRYHEAADIAPITAFLFLLFASTYAVAHYFYGGLRMMLQRTSSAYF